jgi:DNA-directed RNA polymerase subunit M/transcription elongation factor TFIIS
MSYCPCCSNTLLQHIRGSEVYWFCRHCWQEMPVWEENSNSLSKEIVEVEDVPNILRHQKKATTNAFNSKRVSRNGWIGMNNIPA